MVDEYENGVACPNIDPNSSQPADP
jgi:hypothetical protein